MYITLYTYIIERLNFFATNFINIFIFCLIIYKHFQFLFVFIFTYIKNFAYKKTLLKLAYLHKLVLITSSPYLLSFIFYLYFLSSFFIFVLSLYFIFLFYLLVLSLYFIFLFYLLALSPCFLSLFPHTFIRIIISISRDLANTPICLTLFFISFHRNYLLQIFINLAL